MATCSQYNALWHVEVCVTKHVRALGTWVKVALNAWLVNAWLVKAWLVNVHLTFTEPLGILNSLLCVSTDVSTACLLRRLGFAAEVLVNAWHGGMTSHARNHLALSIRCFVLVFMPTGPCMQETLSPRYIN